MRTPPECVVRRDDKGGAQYKTRPAASRPGRCRVFEDSVRRAELIGAADAALYQAKEEGRDRVVAASVPAAEPSSEPLSEAESEVAVPRDAVLAATPHHIAPTAARPGPALTLARTGAASHTADAARRSAVDIALAVDNILAVAGLAETRTLGSRDKSHCLSRLQ